MTNKPINKTQPLGQGKARNPAQRKELFNHQSKTTTTTTKKERTMEPKLSDWIFGSKVEKHNNSDWISIHTRAPLCPRKGYYSPGLNQTSDFPVLTLALIESLESLPGIREVSVQRHKVEIRRSLAYTWEQILAVAVPVFVSYCPATF